MDEAGNPSEYGGFWCNRLLLFVGKIARDVLRAASVAGRSRPPNTTSDIIVERPEGRCLYHTGRLMRS